MTDKSGVSPREGGDDATALAALVDGAPIGLALLDAELRYVRVNAALAAVTGVSVDAHPDQELGAFATEELREELRLAARLALGRGEPVTAVELEGRTLRRPDAERRWLVGFHPIKRPAGAQTLLAMSVREVTLERQAERHQALTGALAEAATVRDVVRALLDHGVALSGASGGVLRVVESDGRTVRLLDTELVSQDIAQALRRFSVDDPMPASEALKRGRTVVAESRAELLERYPALVDERVIDGEAFAFVPLASGARPLGVLALGFAEQRTFPPEFVALLESVGHQGAVALERAQLYERERRTSAVLQRALLPPALPPIPGLDLAGRFRAGAPGFDVGGDFYDAFPIDAHSWELVIGDITGKGVEAAALTSLTRYTVRAAANLGRSPGEVLEALNAAVREGLDGELCTAAVGRLSLADGGAELTLACGGHPAPLVLRGGSASVAGSRGPLIGLDDDLQFREATVSLGPGDAVVFYTDGLTDAAAPAVVLDEHTLCSAVTELGDRSADEIAAGLVERAVSTTSSPRDDIAVLVLKVPAGR